MYPAPERSRRPFVPIPMTRVTSSRELPRAPWINGASSGSALSLPTPSGNWASSKTSSVRPIEAGSGVYIPQDPDNRYFKWIPPLSAWTSSLVRCGRRMRSWICLDLEHCEPDSPASWTMRAVCWSSPGYPERELLEPAGSGSGWPMTVSAAVHTPLGAVSDAPAWVMGSIPAGTGRTLPVC